MDVSGFGLRENYYIFKTIFLGGVKCYSMLTSWSVFSFVGFAWFKWTARCLQSAGVMLMVT